METWPVSLPQDITADFSVKMRSGLADDDEERNPSRTRTYPEYDASFSVFMTPAQLIIFRAWWDNDLNQSAPFTVPWLGTLGFDSHFLKFTEGPSWKNKSPWLWEVMLPVEIIANSYRYVG